MAEWTRVQEFTDAYADLCRIYARGDERMSLAIYRNHWLYGPYTEDRLLFEASYKSCTEEQWERACVPRELIPELIEMLKEVE